MKETVIHTCPCCNHKFNIDIYPVINLQSDTELYNDLFSLDLYRIKCEKCNKITLIKYNTIIVDMFKKYLIYFNSDNSDNIKLQELLNSLKENKEFSEAITQIKHIRTVTSLNELIEKLYIFDYDLNDNIIDMLKPRFIK